MECRNASGAKHRRSLDLAIFQSQRLPGPDHIPATPSKQAPDRLPMIRGKAEADPVLPRTVRYFQLFVLHNQLMAESGAPSTERTDGSNRGRRASSGTLQSARIRPQDSAGQSFPLVVRGSLRPIARIRAAQKARSAKWRKLRKMA